MDIKIINVPLYYGCDNPGTELAPCEFSRHKTHTLIEKCGHTTAMITSLAVLPKPADKFADPRMKYLNEVTDCCKQLSDAVESGIHNGLFPFIIGGDHSLGIGSLAGLRRVIPAEEISVIWVDAHTDINTEQTSESHNIHGMPLAACLGMTDKKLYEEMGAPLPFILPENLFYIGSRSIDPGEEEILSRLNIRTVRMDEIKDKGIEECCRELLSSVKTKHIHISFGVDFMDADEFWATGLPIPDGPSIEEARTVLKTLFSDPRVCSADFVEYSPKNDRSGHGLDCCMQLLEDIFTALKS